MRRVLITGYSGFVGPHVARALLASGAAVSGMGPEATAPVPREASGMPETALVSWHAADLRNAESLMVAVAAAAPDAIVHLAGQSSAARSFEIPEETFAINAIGTWNLLEAVRAAAPRARVLVVGTGEVYGPQTEGSRVPESAAFRPISPYALSKAAADAFAGVFGGQHDLDVIRTRSFGHTGPGQTPRFVVPAFAQQIAAIESGAAEPVLRVGNLEVTRDLLDVRDVAHAYVALLQRGTAGTAYNVCRGVGVKLTEVARMLTQRARVPVRIEADPARMRPADIAYLVGNPAAIESATGWRPEIALDRTLDDVLLEWRGRNPLPG